MITAERRSSDETVAYICGRIAATAVNLAPFPHLVVDDILPLTMFDELTRELPVPSSLAAVNTMGWKSVSQYTNHRTALVRDLPGTEVWQLLDTALTHPDLARSLQRAFEPHAIEARRALKLRREARLDCAGDGGGLRPHTDAPILFMKSLIYMTCAGDHPSVDTVLYVPKDPAARIARFGSAGDYTDETYVHEDLADQIEHTRVAFRPNRLLTFPRTRDSLHGLDPLDRSASPRYVFSIHYKHDPA